MYQIDAGIWSRVFAVPSEIVDRHVKLCGALALKVLLVMLRHARPMDAPELASMLGQSPGDIQDAVNYWVHLGILAQDDMPVPQAPQPMPQPIRPVPEAEPAAPAPLPERREEQLDGRRLVQLGKPRRLTMSEVNELAEEDGNIRALLSEAQAAFGRTLKPTESESVITVYVRFEMPPDLILMLIHYCVSIGKTGMAYIERVAQDWYERGIDTHERVEEELLRLTRQSEAENAIRETFGIYGRHITDREREFYARWTDELGIKKPLIKLAYERTVDAKGKISFAYINAILSDWHKKGVTTPEAALRDIQSGSGQGKKEKAGEPRASYDLDKFEELLQTGSLWD